jgi:hypothetical protein
MLKAEAAVKLDIAASEKKMGVLGGGDEEMISLGDQGMVERWYAVMRESLVPSERVVMCGGGRRERRWSE